MERQNEFVLTPWVLENAPRLAVNKFLFTPDEKGNPLCTEPETGKLYEPPILEVLLVDIFRAKHKEAYRVNKALLEGEECPSGLRELYDNGLFLLRELRKLDEIPPVTGLEFKLILSQGVYKGLSREDILCLFSGRKYVQDYKTEVSVE